MKGLLSIYKKELESYFYSATAYIFLALFIFLQNFLFFFWFGGIFEEGMATMRMYFTVLPFIFAFFIPGLTMGTWAKEKSSGTIELIFTFPINQTAVLTGKFLASLTLVAVGLIFSLFIPISTHFLLGEFDMGQLLAQYIGTLLMAICCISISFFISSLTRELVNSFLISAVIILLLMLVGYLSLKVTFPKELGWIKIVFKEISLYSRMSNFSKGVIDFRDVFYYLGFAAIFFYFNKHSLETSKWS